MKNLLAFFAAAVLVFVGVGWYLDWFHISKTDAASGHQAFSIDVNANKVVSDVEKGGEKAADFIEKARKDAEARKAAAAAKDPVKEVKGELKKIEAGKSE